MAKEEFEVYVNGLLRDWNIQPDWRERVMEAIEFQYTYWPEPDNRTARGQEFINVSNSIACPILFVHKKYRTM